MMNIVIDMQGWQASSRHRGIGRYTISLVNKLVEINEIHKFTLLFNGAFHDSIYEFKKDYPKLEVDMHIWYPVTPLNYLNQDHKSNRCLSEKIYKSVVASLNTEFLLISSVYEGLIDDAICYIDDNESYLSGTILYDLIPLIYPELYQNNETRMEWYKNKTDILARSKYLFSISESAKKEAIKFLGWDNNDIFNISTAADTHFVKKFIPDNEKKLLKDKYNIKEKFLMYTGGWDPRKNLFRLIESYSLLSKDLRNKHQLVIVCSMATEAKNELYNKAISFGLTKEEVVLTGYVSDEELLQLYNLCHAFVFPSWHEGFGLPVLEAMSCGIPVVTSNVSSLPEVINYQDALFDPFDINDIANKLERVLVDNEFRRDLQNHYIKQVQRFNWDLTARKLLAALDNISKRDSKKLKYENFDSKRKKTLAYFSPLPPEKSGISFYSEELLPFLGEYYEIDIVSDSEEIRNNGFLCAYNIISIEEFKKKYLCYERILYQIGNSHFHEHMFELIKKYPGIAVLHDFFLSGAVSWKSIRELNGETFNDKLYESHGYKAVLDNNGQVNYTDAILKYPCNYPILQNALALIYHSKYSIALCNEWYNNNFNHKNHYIPLLRTRPVNNGKAHARKILNINENDILIISLGFIAPTKLNHRVITAFNNLQKDSPCVKLVFVGYKPDGEYGEEIASLINSSPRKKSISITGWVDDDTYKYWLQAADIGIQLRAMSRGETSAAVLDCMNYGLATIANANGSMRELDRDAVVLIDDEFSDIELTEALNKLINDEMLRYSYAVKASKIISTYHSPEVCADKYHDVIESTYSNSTSYYNVLNDVEFIKCIQDDKLNFFAQRYADSFKINAKHKVYLDLSNVCAYNKDKESQEFLLTLINESPHKLQCEPIFYEPDYDRYLYAQTLMNDMCKLQGMHISNKIVDNFKNSFLLIINPSAQYLFNMRHRIADLSIDNTIKLIFLDKAGIDFISYLDCEDCSFKDDYITLLRNDIISIIKINNGDEGSNMQADMGGWCDVNDFVEFMTLNELILFLSK
ncbi:glycosyltransferase [Atlantibacter hermannii]|uniref:glycosyltransferase n=1 Tax=Atlantibacter hermannii TaxID=565 RepID=UPI0028ABFEB4|nr:glycosyltransferase [Atlantibacter hermannii]